MKRQPIDDRVLKAVIIGLCFVLLCPVPKHDDGYTKYNALLYSVTSYDADMGNGRRKQGVEVKILGVTMFSNVNIDGVPTK